MSGVTKPLRVGFRFGWPLVSKGFCFFRGLNVFGRGRHSDFEWGYFSFRGSRRAWTSFGVLSGVTKPLRAYVEPSKVGLFVLAFVLVGL